MSAELGMIAELIDGPAFDLDVQLGPGDDAAVLVPRGNIVITTDVLIENIHFERAWLPAFQTNRKVVVVNVSDIGAMGAKPSAVVIGLAFLRNLDRRRVGDFQGGVAGECVRAGVDLVGDDLSSPVHVAPGVIVLGDLSGRPATTRAGVRVDDQVVMCGQLGCSAGDPLVLQRGPGSLKNPALEQQCPAVSYEQGRVAVEAGVTVMIDASDSPLQDPGHIYEPSGMGIDVRTDALKIHDSLARLVAATGKSLLGFVLVGDEDYASAVTFPAEAEFPQGWLRTGTVTTGVRVAVDGMSWMDDVDRDHFT